MIWAEVKHSNPSENELEEEGHDVNGQGSDRKRKRKKGSGMKVMRVSLLLPDEGITNGPQGICSLVSEIAAVYTGW